MGSWLVIPWFRVTTWTVELRWIETEVSIQPFGAITLLALAVGFAIALAFARKRGLSIDATMSLALYLVVFSFPTAYIFNGILYAPDKWSRLVDDPGGLFRMSLGMSMYGGILGVLIGAWCWKWRSKGSILEIGDAFAFAGPFGWSIARVGCFLVHDHPGRTSDFFLAVADYRVGSPPYEARHDLGLYEALVLACIAVVFFLLRKRERLSGFYVALLPILYAPMRFVLDFLRAPAAEGGDIRYGGLTPAQYGSLILFAAGAALMYRVSRRRAG